MTRIIAGTHGGRRISTPKGDGTRPTSDRVREAMFSSIESELGGFGHDGWVLDLFAGSGALGLEALSRGAAHATFVEHDRRAAAVITANLKDLGMERAEVVTWTASRFVEHTLQDPHFELVLVDPPYELATTVVSGLVRRLREYSAPDALFVVERATRDPFTWPEGVEALRHKKYGETTVWYGR